MSTHQLERSSYTIIGDVAIVSVKGPDELRAARKLAEQIIKRHPRLRAVYAKFEVESELRIPKLQLLLGNEVRETWHKENGLYFHITLGRVYINPRLQNEHLEIGKAAFGKFLDATAGVGFYAIHAAVYSSNVELIVMNDLNPYAVYDALLSIRRNRRRIRAPIVVLNRDARELPRVLKQRFNFIVVDYPQNPEAFTGLRTLCSSECVLVVYFVEREDVEEQRASNLAKLFNCEVASLKRVLDYAPHKYVYRLMLHC